MIEPCMWVTTFVNLFLFISKILFRGYDINKICLIYWSRSLTEHTALPATAPIVSNEALASGDHSKDKDHKDKNTKINIISIISNIVTNIITIKNLDSFLLHTIFYLIIQVIMSYGLSTCIDTLLKDTNGILW